MSFLMVVVATINAIFLLCTAGFMWPYFSSVYIVGLFGALSILVNFFYYCLIGNIYIDLNKILFLIIVSSFYFWIDMPFREHSVFGVYTLYMVSFSFIVIGSNRMHSSIFSLICKLVAFSGWFSLFIFFCYFLGFGGFGYENNHPSSGRPYDLYLFTNVMQSQIWNLNGHDFVRTSGLLNEPGHFGILCAFLLIFDNYKFTNKFYIGIAVGGFLTFSAAFYLLFFALFFVFNFKKIKYMSSFLVMFLFFCFFVFYSAPQGLTDRLFQTHYFDERSNYSFSNLLEARSRGGEEVSSYLDQLEVNDYFIGKGRGFVINNPEYHTSDYRRIIFDAGLIGVLFIFIIYVLFPLFNFRKVVFYGVFVFFVLVAAHRIFLLYYPVYFFLLYFLSGFYGCSNNCRLMSEIKTVRAS